MELQTLMRESVPLKFSVMRKGDQLTVVVQPDPEVEDNASAAYEAETMETFSFFVTYETVQTLHVAVKGSSPADAKARLYRTLDEQPEGLMSAIEGAEVQSMGPVSVKIVGTPAQPDYTIE